MAKPIISKFTATDATKDTTVTFVCYDDGIDSIDYLIYDNASGNIVATDTLYASGKTIYRTFVIPGGTIKNRLLPYHLKIRAHNSKTETASELSDAVLFYCHEKPTIQFMDINSDDLNKISFPAYSFELKYTYIQEHGETLNRYKYLLYDKNKNILSEETYYGAISKSFIVNGLDNHETYYIRAVGETVNGYTLDSGFYEIYVNFSSIVQSLSIKAENAYHDGCVKINAVLDVASNESFDTLRIKRRKTGSFEWATIYEMDVSGRTGRIELQYDDRYALGRNTEYQYCAAPTIETVEQDAITTVVKSDFGGIYLLDKTTEYFIGLDPEISDIVRNQSASVETTLSGQYPIVFYGSEANYYTGHCSGTIIKYDRAHDSFDFDGSIEYREKMIDWLTNKKPKVIKSWDGRGWLANVNGNISIDDSEHYNKVSISFDFVETGSLDKTKDLKAAGLI